MAAYKDTQTGQIWAHNPRTGMLEYVSSPALYGQYGIAANESNVTPATSAQIAQIRLNSGTAATGIGPGGQVGQGITDAPGTPNGPPAPQSAGQAGQGQRQPVLQWSQGFVPDAMVVVDASRRGPGGAHPVWKVEGGALKPIVDMGEWKWFIDNYPPENFMDLAAYQRATGTGGVPVHPAHGGEAGNIGAQQRFTATAPGQSGAGGTSGTTGPGLKQGDMTPFGKVVGEAPGGLGINWHQQLFARMQEYAKQTGRVWRFNKETGDIEDTGDLTAAEQMARQVFNEGQRQFNATFGEGQRQFNEGQRQRESEFGRTFGEGQRQFNVDLGERQRQFDVTTAFEQAKEESRAASNPRDYIYASMLGQSRGGLAGVAPTNQLVREGPAGAPGVLFANAASRVVNDGQLGTPGAADHYATAERPDGTRIHYYGTVTQDPQTGEVANIPVGAFARAAMEGHRIPRNGAIGTTGGFVTGSSLRQGFNPNAIKPRDYYAGNRDERDMLKAVGSAAGYSDRAVEDAIERNTPREGAISGGIRRVA